HAVLDGRDRSLRKGVRGGGNRTLRVHGLRRDDAEVALRQCRGIRSRREASEDVAGPGETETLRVDRVDVGLRDVVGPDLDVVELREIGREQRADRTASHHADPHRAPTVRSRGSENSRPPVRPEGRTITTSAITALTTTMREPTGRSIVCPRIVIPSSISARTESRALTKSAPTTAPHRLVVPPITSIASVMNVRSRYTASTLIGMKWMYRPPANPARSPLSANE